MRRAELQSAQYDEDYEFIITNAPVGHLGLMDNNGYPRIIPINFAVVGDCVYVHGARAGEKYDIIKSGPKASFSVDIPYAFIPSHFTSEGGYACPASHYFKSLHMRGNISEVHDTKEKASALQALMEKYQNEGGYEPLSHQLSMYSKALTEVAVFKLIPNETTLKIKFGQNESDVVIDKIIDKLRRRDGSMDRKTIDEIILRRVNNK